VENSKTAVAGQCREQGTRVHEKLPFALRSMEAHKQIEERQQKIIGGFSHATTAGPWRPSEKYPDTLASLAISCVWSKISAESDRRAEAISCGVRNPVLEPGKGLKELAELIRCWSMRLNGPR
jgi:hypothetical protein